MVQLASFADLKTPPVVSGLATIRSGEFRQAYHQALNSADQAPAAQQTAARGIIERYFSLEETSPSAPLSAGALYFADGPIAVDGKYKFLVPGTIKRELIAGPLFLLRQKAAPVERLVGAKEFDSAIAVVEAVRLTLMPERVNGIISFISDAKQFYAGHNAPGAERAIGTALDHLNRAATEGLRRIKSDAERGKRSNEISGTRRTLFNLRTKLQTELRSFAETGLCNCADPPAA